MKITVLGSGMVGQTIAGKLDELGHVVEMGTRDAATTGARTEVNRMTGSSFAEWHKNHTSIELKDFDQISPDADLYVNATSGSGTLDALCLVGKKVLKDKVILDISNPLDFTKGMPPTLSVSNIDSLAEQIQAEFEDAHVVKGLNTMTSAIMVNPALIPGEHHVFICGNNADAKSMVSSLLNEFGWSDSMIMDLGDITAARGAEMVLPLWLRIYGKLGTAAFNFHIAKP